MANAKPILYLPAKFAQALPVTGAPEPILTWDAEQRRMVEPQQTNGEGVPLWRVPVLLGQGWSGELAPVEVRVAAVSKPDIQPNPSALMTFIGGDDQASASRRSA